MNRDLEALLRAYDAAKQASGPEEKNLILAYESLLFGVLEQNPGLSRDILESAIHRAYVLWLKAQNNPTTLSPKA
jgi:hypothetical protein